MGLCPWLYDFFLVFFLFGGLHNASMCLAVTVFFMDCVDRKFFFTDFFAKIMYTAYLIHAVIFLLLAARSLVLVFELTGNMKYVVGWEGGYYYITNPNMTIPAFLFVFVLTMIYSWPVSYGICSLPGFDQVLR